MVLVFIPFGQTEKQQKEQEKSKIHNESGNQTNPKKSFLQFQRRLFFLVQPSLFVFFSRFLKRFLFFRVYSVQATKKPKKSTYQKRFASGFLGFWNLKSLFFNHRFLCDSSSSMKRRVGVVVVAGLLVALLIALSTDFDRLIEPLMVLDGNNTATTNPSAATQSILSAPHRKLLGQGREPKEPNRMWGEKCSKADIIVNQGLTAPLPNGIPTYTVQIMNVCSNGCDISGIHLNCGWFSSARMINPKVFKRLRYDDCLVNDGKSLVNGGTLSFQYANTYKYPLSVSSVRC